ncbi:hypothetical protein EX895_005747 [Sporisorium graminicola]|uniref:Histone H1 n=1 Tax=Sporisorium graminicola TaxID=280036 RepID=A0A4U7KMJ0_9BASI|nr:hypothetical protein EX895_005747 [Sporisorium graminicola]TKY85585.1 hypothetical protein EX895_005747 [Sporisorium graminicola]
MTAATAPSPSPAPSAPSQHAHTPTRQSPVASDGAPSSSSSRRHDGAPPSAASPAKVTINTLNNLGTIAKPIDLASPPASPTLAATTLSASDTVASDSTRSLQHQPSPSPSAVSSAGADAAVAALSRISNASPTLPRPPPYASALATPNRLLPPTPLGNASDRSGNVSSSASASVSTPSKSALLPTPYKAPRLTQSGSSESFATAYPTQETRQKYASPSKPLPTALGATPSHKRSWQSSGSADLSNKKFRPTASAISSPGPVASSTPSPLASVIAALPTMPKAGASAAVAPRPPPAAASTTGRADNASSGVTVTNIPKPGSSISNQAGAGPLNLTPAISGVQLSPTVKDEYLSLLQKAELIDLVKQLEKQLTDLVEAPAGSSTLYRQARVYPNHIHVQMDRLKARQRIEASTTPAPSDLSLKDVYSLLNASASASTTSPYARTAGATPRPSSSPASALTGRPAYTPPSAPRRPLPTLPAASAATSLARGISTAGATAQKVSTKDTSQNASLTNLINSINAMVRQQNQPARGPNGAPLPPAHMPSSVSSSRPALPPAAGKGRPATSAQPQITPAALRSIVGDGPMPSNAALAAAIAAHFGGNIPANAATAATPRPASASAASSAAAGTGTRVDSAAANASSTAGRTAPASALASSPDKDLSEKIAAILGSSSSSQATMLGPQGLPLAPATSAPGSSAVPIGNIAAMLSSFAGQASSPTASAGSPSAAARSATPAAQGQDSALSSLLQQLEEAKKRLPSQSTASPAPVNASTASQAFNSVRSATNDPIAILTGVSANPVYTPSYTAGANATSSPMMAGSRLASWSPDPQPVIVQGPLGTSTLPSYEDMIVEGLRVMGQAPPRTLFNWMQDTYPLTKKFRPSAHQALQKAFKRGRLLKTGSLYRINQAWSDPGESRKPTRRPQVGRDHPMVTPGLNGEVLAVSPLKDSQAYRNVGDSGLRAYGKGLRTGPRPYGQPGAAPLANPASTIFPSGSATEILLEYQKRIGKKIEPDSVRYLYQLIRSGPSDGSMEEMLAHMLTQTGYHDAAAEATAAAAAQTAAATAASMSSTMPSYPRPSMPMPGMATGMSAPSSLLGRSGASAAATAGAPDQRRMPPISPAAARGPTSLPLPTTSEPTMMQQLASMLNDTSSPINPVLANSILGQLSSNAAALAAARAANLPGMSAGPPLPAVPARTLAPASSAPPPSASSQLASALSSLAGQAPQQDLDSAVSETLAAALQQIGAAPTATTRATASEDVPKEVPATQAVAQPKTVEATDESSTQGVAAAAREEGEEGIDLAEYEDAIRALTSAFGNADDEADSEESDVEADERAIAAAEAEPDSVDVPASNPTQQGDVVDTGEQAEGEQAGEADEGEDEDEVDDDDEAAESGEQMDLSAVLRQLTASLQAHHEGTSTAQAGDEGQAAATQDSQQEAEAPASTETEPTENMDVDPPTAEEPRDAEAEPETGSQDAASLQAQLEALVASLAANAGNADDDDDEEEEYDEDEDDQEGDENNAEASGPQ